MSNYELHVIYFNSKQLWHILGISFLADCY